VGFQHDEAPVGRGLDGFYLVTARRGFALVDVRDVRCVDGLLFARLTRTSGGSDGRHREQPQKDGETEKPRSPTVDGPWGGSVVVGTRSRLMCHGVPVGRSESVLIILPVGNVAHREHMIDGNVPD
jgi:hypothetical protein